MDSQANTLQVVFTKRWRTEFGKGVWLIGNTFDLGEWNIEKARKLTHYPENNWVTKIRLPLDSKIQYKYFISDYENVNSDLILWEQINGNNHQEILSIPRPPLPIKICSFNIRYLNKNDKGNIHWDARKKRIVEYVNKHGMDVLGVQEATFPQRQYLEQYLKGCSHFGKARDLHKDQQCGIFIKDKYTVIEDQYCWISETKKQGEKGYDAKLPRYYTTVVICPRYVQTTYKRAPCIVVINTHLDHEGKLARKKGIEHILSKCIELAQKYRTNQEFQLTGFVVMGDFNESQSHSIFDIFRNDKEIRLKSMRNILPNADKSFTFNGFSSKNMLKLKQFVMNDKLTIDHMFVSFTENSPYKPIEFEVIKPESQIQVLSDHFPILGVFSRSPNTPLH